MSQPLGVKCRYGGLADVNPSEQRVLFNTGKGFPKKNANVPEGEPPRGYVCYRCGQKGRKVCTVKKVLLGLMLT